MIDDSLRTLVLGLGNPIRGDDGVGWRVVEAVQDNLPKVRTESRSEGKSEEKEREDPQPGVPPGERKKEDPHPALPQEEREKKEPEPGIPPGERKREDPHPALPQGERERVEVDTLAGGGLNLMERLVGYDRAILVDAMQGGNQPGTVQVFPLEALENPSAGHLGSTHETNLLTALEIGRNLGAHLPQVGAVVVVAIEAQPVFEFSEELSPAVELAVPEAVEIVMNLLNLC